MRIAVLCLLLLVPLAGCVVPTDPLRMAAYGPTTGAAVEPAGHALREGERIALVIRETQLDPARLHACIAAGMRPRLPSPGASIVALDEAGVARLLAALPSERDAALPEEVAALGVEWAVVVRDSSTRAATPERDFGGHGASGGGIIGGYVGERVEYGLSLEAAILDLRARRRLGMATAWYAARGGGGVAAGIMAAAGGGLAIAVPFILPVIRLPAGTTAMAICDAFGRAIGDALVKATTPQPPAGAAPPEAATP